MLSIDDYHFYGFSREKIQKHCSLMAFSIPLRVHILKGCIIIQSFLYHLRSVICGLDLLELPQHAALKEYFLFHLDYPGRHIVVEFLQRTSC